MLENHIHSESKELFEEQLNDGNVPKEAIAFIKDTKEIWNNGDYYGGSGTVDTELSDTSENAVQNKVVKAYVDNAIAGISIPPAVTIDSVMSASSTNPVQNKVVTNALANKVDKVTGKGLSTNDYTTTEKNKLAGIAEGAEVNVQSDWNATSGDAYIKNKPSLATVATSGSYNDLSNKPIIPIETIVDTSMSSTSTNPVQNKVVTAVINGIDTRVQEIEGFFDEGAKLNLTIKSNQGTDGTISAVKAIIEYDGQSVQAGSGVIGLPVFTDIKITFPDVEGYKTPAPLEFTTGALPVVYEVTYETELVNVTVTAWDGTSVVGQIITINGTQYTWNGTTIQHKVPFGTTYNVVTSELDGYIRPDESFTASVSNRIISLQYAAMVGSWITLNQTITDPTTMISGDVNGEHIQLIRNNSHRYLGKYTADGTMTVCQLDDTDSNLYADGATATLTGAEGDVFMKLPKFYYCATEKQTDVWAIGFYYGESAPSSQWREWDGNDLIGVFLSGNEPRSIANVKITSYPYKSIKDAIESRGNGFSLFRWEHNSIIIFLTYALYGRTDITAVVGGEGATTFYVGDTISLGMEDTTPDNASKSNTWGIESFVEKKSNMLQYIDGAFYRLEVNKMFFDIERSNGETQRYQVPRNGNTTLWGWISKIYIGKHLDILYKSYDASSTSGFCSFFQSQNNIGTSVRPACRNYTFCGISNSDYATTTDSLNTNLVVHAARITFKGTINIQNNSTAFKALTAIG